MHEQLAMEIHIHFTRADDMLRINLECMLWFYHAVTVIFMKNEQNMKPVQNCTGFIFFTFYYVVHL